MGTNYHEVPSYSQPVVPVLTVTSMVRIDGFG